MSISTVSSSVIIEQLKANCASKPNLAIAYFYFDFNESEKQNATSFVTTLIAQLCNHVVGLPEKLKELYRACNNGRGVATLDALRAALFAVVDKFGDVFIVADALDECPNNENLREELLELIKDMSTQSSSNIHLLVTSRPEPDIEELLLSLSTTRVISIQGSPIEADIKSYICHEISSESKLKKFPVEEQEKIKKRLLLGRMGYKALESLPETLHKTYNRILQNIDAQNREMACHALTWFASSKRPLEIEDVANAAVLDPEANTAFEPDKRLFDPNSILEILGSLVTPSSEDGASKVIRLAHFSVQEYLVSQEIKSSDASKFGIIDVIPDLFIAKNSEDNFLFKDLIDIAKPVYYASAMGLETVVPLLLEKGANVNAKTGDGKTALQIAAKNGHTTIARLLLDRGADVDSEDSRGRTPLYWAAVENHITVMRLLLARNANEDKINRVTIRVPA
ncbi:hypothetical protein MMC31_005688 [Peltigera leucophlebia]|nr:hypothetical protein [Peltigera leucophlebia]